MKEKLTVILDDCTHYDFVHEKDYTEYEVRNGLFILIYENKWVAFFNLAHVVSMIVCNEN